MMVDSRGKKASDRQLTARSAWFIPLAVSVTTGAVGAFGLGTKGLWHDEAFSAAIARLEFPTMWKAIIDGDVFNGLYYLLLHQWVKAGDGEVWLRLPSVMFGILAVLALFVLCRHLFDVKTALIASTLLAINSFFVQYEQEARPYSLAVALVVLATYLFVLAVEGDSVFCWLRYGAISAVAIYAHVFAAYVVFAHVLSLTLLHRRPRLKHALASYALTALLVAPLLVVAQRSSILQRAFIKPPDVGSFVSLFLHLTGAGGVSTRGGRLLLLAYFVVCSAAILFMGRQALEQRKNRTTGTYPPTAWSFWLILLWLVVPVLTSFIVSVLLTPSFFPRYLLVVLPALVIIAAIGVSSLPSLSLQALALVGLLTFSIPPMLRYYGADFKEGQDWKGAVAYVVEGERPGDGVVFLSRYGRRPFEYYLERSGGFDLEPIYPRMGWGHYVTVLSDLHIEPTPAAVARLPEFKRVWVVLVWRGFATINENGEAFRTAFAHGYQVDASHSFGPALEVRLYQRRSG
jgi:mannosyltransferase